MTRAELADVSFRVLLIDDDLTELLLLEELLAQPAVDLVTFTDAAAAWTWLQQQPAPPHLTLLDLHLTGLDALTLLRWIRAQPIYNDMAVVLRSGLVSAEELRIIYEVGGNAIVDKQLFLTESGAQLQAVMTAYRRLRDAAGW